MDRVNGFYPFGWGFESLTGHHLPDRLTARTADSDSVNVGSNPAREANACIAQLAEHRSCKAGVICSNHIAGTIYIAGWRSGSSTGS